MVNTKATVAFLIVQLLFMTRADQTSSASQQNDDVRAAVVRQSQRDGAPAIAITRINSMTTNANEPKRRRRQAVVAPGIWGGQHIRMNVTVNGADIEYDCARGTISGKLALNSAGTFTVGGTHMREGPGPVRLGQAPGSHPARYSGKVTGDKMSLTVILTDTSQTLGSFELRRGSEGRIRKCR